MKVRKNGQWSETVRNKLILNFTTAMARSNTSIVRRIVTEGIHWNAIGRKPVVGADAFCKVITRYGPATKLTIKHVVSDSHCGAVDGVIEFGNNHRAFSHVYEFGNSRGTRISALTSFSHKIN